jgi:hypothetical protein
MKRQLSYFSSQRHFRNNHCRVSLLRYCPVLFQAKLCCRTEAGSAVEEADAGFLSGGRCSLPGQSVCNLWWAEWHWEGQALLWALRCLPAIVIPLFIRIHTCIVCMLAMGLLEVGKIRPAGRIARVNRCKDLYLPDTGSIFITKSTFYAHD